MSTDYTYDEQGQFFPFFVGTITALFTIPITYSALKPPRELENTAPRVVSDFKPDEADSIEKQRRRQKRQERKVKRIVAAALGWAVIAWMIYLMVNTSRTVPKVWDPYNVLGVSRNADEKQITKHYRKLSITYHPDKRRPDVAKNETMETINDDWVDITKAFKALTDEEIRNNYLKYGHPDGKQSFSIGIALPQFIVTEGNGKYVLLLYGSLLGVLLPYLVGSWWYGTQRRTKEKILVTSAASLFKEFQDEMSEGDVIGALSTGQEFDDVLPKGSTSAKAENAILKIHSDLPWLTKKDLDRMRNIEDDTRRQTLALLWAHLGRIDLGEGLNELRFATAPIALSLNESFMAMLPFFGNTQSLLAAYRTSQSIVQALPPGSSPLLQIPYFTKEHLRLLKAETGKTTTSLQRFMALPEAQRKKVLGNLSAGQYLTAMHVASQLPLAHVEKAFFKVVGERHVTPGSLINLVIKLRIIPPGFEAPPVDPKDLEDKDPAEGDVDALNGRKENDKVQPPLAHAPYFPADRSPRWRAFLGEGKSGRIAVPPFTFSTFDKPLFDESQKPTFNVQTLRCAFQAPGQPGEYAFTLHLICDSYLGIDSKLDVIMEIADPSKAELVDSEDEISEPEEGQMAALKGQASDGKPALPRKKKILTADDVSSGSDTEGDDDSDGSDTDTDTDTDTDEE